MKDHYMLPFVLSTFSYGCILFLYYETLFSNELFWFDTYIYTLPPLVVGHLVLLRFLIPTFTKLDILKIVNRIYLIIYIIFILNIFFVVPSFKTQNDSIHPSLYLVSHILWLVPMIGWIITNKLKTLKDE
jgi:hypothetical protein